MRLRNSRVRAHARYLRGDGDGESAPVVLRTAVDCRVADIGCRMPMAAAYGSTRNRGSRPPSIFRCGFAGGMNRLGKRGGRCGCSSSHAQRAVRSGKKPAVPAQQHHGCRSVRTASKDPPACDPFPSGQSCSGEALIEMRAWGHGSANHEPDRSDGSQ